MKSRAILLVLVASAALALAVPLTSATQTLEWLEDFEVGAAGGAGVNPDFGGYDYTEKGWPFAGTSTNRTGASGTKSFCVNQTSAASLATACVSWFNFTSRPYNRVSFYFNIEETSNNATVIEFWDGVHKVVWLNISKTRARVYNATDVQKAALYITDDTWYKVQFTINYTDDQTLLQVYNTSNATWITGNETWIDINSTSDTEALDHIVVKNVAGQYSECYFDDLYWLRTGSARLQYGAVIDLVNNFVPVLIFLGLFATVFRSLALIKL